ncbi:MAG: hypothetical protein ACT6R2_18445, partial [Blastomonas fulva]|uniref:hypothetical protein n=1 Tax=Blastomonas fulva TaxID=1550728 RepID=UPI0040339B37
IKVDTINPVRFSARQRMQISIANVLFDLDSFHLAEAGSDPLFSLIFLPNILGHGSPFLVLTDQHRGFPSNSLASLPHLNLVANEFDGM